MKAIHCLTALVLLKFNLAAQDIITTKNGDEIKAKVLEIESAVIKYRKWENQNGPLYSMSKSEIFMIKYENGTKDVFKDEPTKTLKTSPTTSHEGAVRLLEQSLKNMVQKESAGTLSFLEFIKVNGQETNLGVKMYSIQYKFKIQALKSGYLPYYQMEADIAKYILLDAPPKKEGWFDNMTPAGKPVNKGQIVEVRGTASYSMTDNGWKREDNDVEGFTLHSVAPITYQAAAQTSGDAKQIDYTQKSRFVKFRNGRVNISSITITDELNNIRHIQTLVMDAFTSMPLLEDHNRNTITEDYEIVANIEMSYPSVNLSNGTRGFFASAVMRFELFNAQERKLLAQFNMSKTNRTLLGKPFAQKLEAQQDLLTNEVKSGLYTVFYKAFPVSAIITDVTDTKKKGEEAKHVKINVGNDLGILTGFLFKLADDSSNSVALQVIGTTAKTATCKVLKYEKELMEKFKSNTEIKVLTAY